MVLLALAIAFFGSSTVYAQDVDIFKPISPIELGPNADTSQPSSDAATYYFTMYPGASYYNSSTLYADAPADYDTYVMTVTETTTVTIEVEDCCIMGDTICGSAIVRGKRRTLCATSPDTVIVTKTLPPGTYEFNVGYQDCPGGYPAGYYVYGSGS